MKKKLTVYHPRFLPFSETFIYRQIHGLSQFFDLTLLVNELENREEFSGLNPISIPSNNIWRRLTRYNEKFILKYLKKSNLFHVNFGYNAVAMQQYASIAGIPMTAYFLGWDASGCLRNKEYREQLKEATFDAVFVNSQDMKIRLTPYLPSEMDCHVVYCGIPLERFPFKLRRSVPEGATFLQVSRLDGKKGVDITIKAFSQYIKKDPSARLIIAGDGPLKEELLRLTSELGLEGHVNFLGFIGYKKYIELLHAADVFIHPSVTSEEGDMEGLPNAVCEAMACGLPVISTRHSGIPEVIDDGLNGFLVEERDVEGLCSRMISLKNTDIEMISNNARKKIEEKFDHKKTVAELAGHMNKIISGGVGGY